MKLDSVFQPVPGSVQLAQFLFRYGCAIALGVVAYMLWSPL